VEDPQAIAALQRINERNQWAAGWFLCVTVTLLGLVQIAIDWHSRTATGKTTAAFFVSFLIIWPILVAISRKRGRTISSGAIFMAAYLVLLITIEAFGPLARAR
jgi:hypothetical protein